MSIATVACQRLLTIDASLVAQQIETAVRDQVLSTLRRKGVVIGLSGGIDSSVVAALCTRALGADRVLGLMMPEAESSEDSEPLAGTLAKSLGIATIVENITATLQGCGCYRRRDEAIRTLVPEYGPGWRCKLVLPDAATGARYALHSLVVTSPDGETRKVRLSARVYLEIVAATNFKQRVRKMIEYYHADRLQYAVAGTPNRLEYDQGFFVKNGDGAADIKPIAHLYKSQVYQLADYLQLPDAIRCRPSTTDTYSLPQSQEEFYFSVPLPTLDLCIYGENHGLSPKEVALATGLSCEQVETVYRAIESKRNATRYLHQSPLLVEDIPEITHLPIAG